MHTPVQDLVRVTAQSYTLRHGLLHYHATHQVGHQKCHTGWVVAVPQSMRNRVIQECHSSNVLGHNGIIKTVLELRQRYHFPALRKAVIRYIANWNACVRAKSMQMRNVVALYPMFAPVPFNAIAIDLFKSGVTLAGYIKITDQAYCTGIT